MHIISQISSLLKVQPSESPSIPFEFFPIPFSKYITIYNDNQIQSNYYDYFNDVIEDIKFYLDKNEIKIIQFLNSPSEKKLNHCYYIEKFTYSQINYLIKNSLLHICTDSYTNEISGITNTKSICLIGNRYAQNSYCWYGNKNNLILSDLKYKKPSFSNFEDPKSINNIKTENISNEIFSLLDISFKNKYKTIYVGSKYHENITYDVIPNFKINDYNYKENSVVNIRLDKFNNENNCIDFCSKNKHNLYVKSFVSKNFVNAVKNNCKNLIFFVDNRSEVSDIEFYVNNGMKIQLFYKNNQIDKSLIFKFLDYTPINLLNTDIDNSLKLNCFNKYLKSSKIIISTNKEYISYAHLEKNIQLGIINNCIDNDLFWQDYLYYKIIGDNNED
jgi:hypothetical protein